MVNIYTSQFRYNGLDRIDITCKTKDPLGSYFSPPFFLVDSYKKGLISEKEYQDHYLLQLRRTYKLKKEVFNQILEKNSVTFVCYCNKNNFCHRFILADCFVKLGAEYKGEINPN